MESSAEMGAGDSVIGVILSAAKDLNWQFASVKANVEILSGKSRNLRSAILIG